MMRLVLISVVLASTSLGIGVACAACASKDERRSGTTTAGCKSSGCEKARKFEPYEPARSRSGGLPGFVDVGGGTQVRIGGRVRTEFQYSR